MLIICVPMPSQLTARNQCYNFGVIAQADTAFLH